MNETDSYEDDEDFVDDDNYTEDVLEFENSMERSKTTKQRLEDYFEQRKLRDQLENYL